MLPPASSIDVAGVATSYHEAGTGLPVVFVYGGNFGTADSAPSPHIWDLNFGPAAARHRAIVVDKLGQGYTGNPLVDEDYTMAAVVRHLADFLRAKDLPPAHLVGHSRGGYAVTRLAMLHPELVHSLTIVSSGTLSPGVGTNEVALAKPPHPPFSRASVRWVYENYCARPEVVTEAWVDAVMAVMAQPKYRASVDKMGNEGLSAGLFLPMLAREKRETLQWLRDGRLQRPTQIIWGENDTTVIPERGFELFAMIAAHERRASYNVINKAGHFSYREHAGRFNGSLLSFIDGVTEEDR